MTLVLRERNGKELQLFALAVVGDVQGSEGTYTEQTSGREAVDSRNLLLQELY